MFAWTFSNQKNRSASWYIIVTIVMLTLLIYGIITQLYLMAIVVILFTGIYIYVENNSIPEIRVILDSKTIQVDTTQYFWDDFTSFSIPKMNGHAYFLRLFPKNKLSTYIDIPFSESVNIDELQIFLSEFLLENENSELSQMDALLHMSKI